MNNTENLREHTLVDTPAHWCCPTDPGLEALLTRLESQSLQPDFAIQRESAYRLVLKPYFDTRQLPKLSPLPEEVDIAQLYLDADYWPNDGHAALVEQIRDLITEHVPEEERVWLDPIRHSYMDLLEVRQVNSESQPTSIHLCSLGNAQEFHVPTREQNLSLKSGQILLTRLLWHPSCISFPRVALILSKTIGQMVFKLTNELRLQIEASSGEFALAEWPEFAKKYGYLMIWSLATVRKGAVSEADTRVVFLRPDGQPYLFALALYEHHEYRFLTEGLDQLEGLDVETPALTESEGSKPSESTTRVWVQPSDEADKESLSGSKARLTLTPTQLIVETDSPDRLDSLKHQLASTFGFSLHFKGEITTPPAHSVPEVDLLSDSYNAPPVVVSSEEELKMLSTFLELVYLEWAEQPSPSLDGQTPRHYSIKGDKSRLGTLIDQMEQQDLARRRTGTAGYDYNILRAHVGL